MSQKDFRLHCYVIKIKRNGNEYTVKDAVLSNSTIRAIKKIREMYSTEEAGILKEIIEIYTL